MSAGIKRERGRAFINRSVSEGCADTLQAHSLDESLRPQPCSRWSSSTFTNSAANCSDTLENLKTSIMKEMRLEITKIISPLVDEVKQLRHEIQTLKTSSNVETTDKCVRAECRTNDIACSTSEPPGMLKDTKETENIYHDASSISPRLNVPPGIDNQLYGYIQENTQIPFKSDDATKEENQGSQPQCRTMSNNTTKPKEIRSNSLQTRVKTVAIAPRPRSAIHMNKVFDERECLANALQFYIQDLVDGLIFRDSELPDSLLQDGCLTEDECSVVRKLSDRKDQIRILLTLVKGRDLRVLKTFLKHVESQNPVVAKNIHAKFEKNKAEGVKGKLCALCKLEKQFNVKHVADGLWSIEAIDDGLYNRIIFSDSPVGAQSALWKRVIHSLSVLDPKKAEQAHNKLISDLSSKNLFVHLADGVNDMLIKNHGKLTCSCEPKLFLPKRNFSFGATTSAESNLPDSLSEGNSNDSSSFDGTDSVDIQGNVCTYTDGMSVITEVTETTPSPSSNVHNMTYTYPQVADTVPLTDLDNISAASIQEATSMGKQQSTRIHRSSMEKIPPVKPPVPLKKPDIKPKHISHSKTPDITIPMASAATLNSHVADVGLTADQEDRIPPLPKKKYQARNKIL